MIELYIEFVMLHMYSIVKLRKYPLVFCSHAALYLLYIASI